MNFTEKKIIGLVGETGAGKDIFSSLILKNFPNTKFFRFSETLSDILGLFFDDIKKEDQQWLANTLRDRFGEDILLKSIAKKIEKEEGLVLLNGIRVREELDFIKDIGGIIVYITAGQKLRWERVRKRGERGDDDVSYEKFLEIDSGRTEQQIKELGKMADIVIKNDKEIRDLEEEAKKLIDKLQ